MGTKVPSGMMQESAMRAILDSISRNEVTLIVNQLVAGLNRGLLEIFDWNGARAHIPDGALAADGQVFYAANYPEVAAALACLK